MLKIIYMIAIFFMLSCKVSAYPFEVNPSYDTPSPFWGYSKSSYFVKAPAHFGYYSLYPVGYILYFPVILPCESFDRFSSNSSCKHLTHNTFSRLGYYVIGVPFYTLEKTFWDGPCYLYDSVFGDNDDNKVEKSNKRTTVGKHQVPGQKNPPPPPQENDSEKR